MGGMGSGRTGGVKRYGGYQKLTLAGVTRRVTILGRRFRIGPRYTDAFMRTGIGMFSLEWTPCNFGGHRPWFTCPTCGRRAGALFAPQHATQPDQWRCRHCRGLQYATQHEGGVSNDIARTWRAARKLGLSVLVERESVKRPPGMRRKTFAQRLGEYTEAHARLVVGMGAHLAATRRRRASVEQLIEQGTRKRRRKGAA